MTTEPEAEKADRLPEKTGDLVVDALLMLGRLMLLSGNAVSDIDIELRGAARAWNAPEAQFIVLPNMMLASFEVDKPAHIMSRDLAADHLRLDQVIRLMHMSRMIRLGEVTPEDALDEMRRIETSQRRRALIPMIVGTIILTLGVALLVRPEFASIPLYIGLGGAIGLMQGIAMTRLPSFSPIMPVLISFVAALIAFGFTGDKYDAASIEALIPALTMLLPGLPLTVAAIDLASGESVSGSSRFLEGVLQLGLVVFGIFVAASVLGVEPSTAVSDGESFPSWAPWLGVAVFAAGVSIREAAPLKMIPWLLLILFGAHTVQALGDLAFGPVMSGFVAAVVIVPGITYVQRFKSSPPALALFIPAFMLLIPDALSLLGVSEVISTGAAGGVDGLVRAVSAILAIALGILVGARVIRIFKFARKGAHLHHVSLHLPHRNTTRGST